jgi:hypothetical protein
VAHELIGGLNGGCGIVLENVLTRWECKRFIAETEAAGYGKLGQGKTGAAYRGNRRVQLEDVGGGLGREIWRRIERFLPKTEALPGEPGVFEFEELNPRYRFAKYGPGEGFCVHVDKPTVFEPQRCSIYTVNIYLNDLADKQHGRTRFYARMGGKPIAAAGGVAGSAVIFKQAVVDSSPLHDGEELVDGLKYLMRTDVIYRHNRERRSRAHLSM